MMYKILYLACFIWLSGIAPALAQQATAESTSAACTDGASALAEGDRLLAAGRYDAAMNTYGCAMQQAPDDYVPVAQHARAALLAGHYITADHDFYYLRGTLMAAHRGVIGSVIVDTSQALAAAPDDLSLHLFRGYANLWREQYEAALEDFQFVLERDPNNVFALIMSGTIALEDEKPEDAAQAFARAIELAPKNPDVYLEVAGIYDDIGITDKILDNVQATLELGSAPPLLYLARADGLTATGQPEAGAADYVHYLEIVAPEVTDGGTLTPGQPLTVALEPGKRVQFTFSASAGQHIDATTKARPDTTDTVAVILKPDGTPLRGNDDSLGLSAVVMTDAPQDGQYTLWLGSLEGFGKGKVTVTLALQ